MRVATLLAAALLFGCDKAGDDEDACGDVAPISGATETYANGHPLDWHETDPDVVHDEMRLMELMNNYRASRGRNPLSYYKALTRCARGHSRHHHVHGLFQGHTNPEGDEFAARMAKNGIEASTSGENISYGALTPVEAFDGWLNSPPHRENMERECFTRIGIGSHGGVWTANFAR